MLLKIIFCIFVNQNIYCWYSKETSNDIFKVMEKSTIYSKTFAYQDLYVGSFLTSKMSFSPCIYINEYNTEYFVCLLVLLLYVPKSTAMVIAGRSVHLTTLFPGQA